ncbi:hypothetical protein ABIF69_004857 [Bradyrhizobium japonicum]
MTGGNRIPSFSSSMSLIYFYYRIIGLIRILIGLEFPAPLIYYHYL